MRCGAVLLARCRAFSCPEHRKKLCRSGRRDSDAGLKHVHPLPASSSSVLSACSPPFWGHFSILPPFSVRIPFSDNKIPPALCRFLSCLPKQHRAASLEHTWPQHRGGAMRGRRAATASLQAASSEDRRTQPSLGLGAASIGMTGSRAARPGCAVPHVGCWALF